MTAYIIVEVDVMDSERYEEYKEMTPPTIAKFGGRFVSRGEKIENLEGARDPARIVIIEFETRELAKSWWESEDYRPARELRQKIAATRMILVNGVE